MWKLIIGITVGIALGISGAMLSSSSSTDYPQSNPAHSGKPTITVAPDQTSEEGHGDDDAGSVINWNLDNRVIYEGHGTVIMQRQNGDSNELLVVTPRHQFVSSSIWGGWPISPQITDLQDAGQLLVMPFKMGSGTGIDSQSALIVLLRSGQEPAVAEVWHQGYSMTSAPEVYHIVENTGYRIEDNTLLCDYAYFIDNGDPTVDTKPYTHRVELQPGEMIQGGQTTNPLARFASGYPLEEENDSTTPDSVWLINRDLIAETDEQTQWVSITLIENDEPHVLHEFRARQNIYDIAISPDGRFGYVWHDEYSPRKLSIFDLDTREKLTTFVPGVGGQLRWSPGNTICQNYGFGTNSFGYVIYDTAGETIARGSSSGGDYNADASLMVTFPTIFAATDAVRIIDTATGEVIREIVTDDQGRTLEVINEIFWTRDGLRLEYFYDPEAPYSQPAETIAVTLDRTHGVTP